MNTLDDASLTYLELDSKWAPEKPLDREAIAALVAEVVAWREEFGCLEAARERVLEAEFEAGNTNDLRIEIEDKDIEIEDLQVTVAALEAKIAALKAVA